MKPRLYVTITAAIAVIALAIWAAAQPPRWKVIAAYRTSLDGRTSAQARNARLAADALNGKVLPPGAEFSFNRAVGSWTADRGYVKAPVSFNGELIPSWGGGVCQTSTTLYNAALLAGMQVVERHKHRFPAHYAPPGQDAAVAQFDIDLRFRNPYPRPIRIEADAGEQWLTCRVLSQKTPGAKFSVEREIRQVTRPGEVLGVDEDVRTSDSPRWRVVNHGAPGLRVAVFRRETTASGSARKLISEDTYPPLNRLVEVR